MKIVIVDPSRVVLKLVTATLEDAGYEVVPYTDATNALERVRSDQAVDVLITSLQPHGMTGLELCAKARDLAGARRPLYVLVMSSSSERNAIIDSLDSGADDFIGKPPAPEELLARLRVAARVAKLQGDLIRLAMVDAMTGLLNRRAFFETAGGRARRADAHDAVAIFDIDRFKQINDTYGHACGDAAIVAVAHAAAATGLVVGRLGGEEFGILMPDVSVKRAVSMCEDLRVTVAAMALPQIDPNLKITCSFGAGEWLAMETIDDALKRADIALYAAKSGGRNRVIAATAPGMDSVIVSPAGAQRRVEARL